MAVEIIVRDNVKQAAGALGQLSRQAEISAQRAAVKSAWLIRDAERTEMAQVFDNPTRWTLNALQVVTARAGEPIFASVRTKDGYWHRADNYLDTQIEGGQRRFKAFENALRKRGLLPAGWYVVPGQKAKIDAYGNMSTGQIRQILSWFGSAELVLGSTQNMTEATRNRRRRGTRRRRGFEYFLVYPGAIGPRGRKQSLTPGVYRRSFFAFGSAIEPIMIFVQRAAYRPRFDFYGVARRVVNANFNRFFNEDYAKRLARIR